MVRTKLKMNTDLKEAFSQIKPVCDILLVCPSMETLAAYLARVTELKKEIVQELQQYLLYPLICRIKCSDIKRRVDMHLKLLDAVRIVLEKITINSFEMYMKLENGLLNIIFDANKPGMISDTTEEIKYRTIRCLTVLMLSIPHEFRLKLLKNQVPMLAQVVFVSVHIAKMERLRILRVAAIHCVTAHTMTHPELTVEYRMPDEQLELLAVDNMLSSILPGVLGALQDVCACTDNPTHVVIAAALEAIHRILCIPMHNKYLPKKTLTGADFINLLKQKKTKVKTEVSNKAQKSPKDMAKRSEEWFAMAGEKLTLITKSLVSLRTYDHFKVRKELAVFCCRILTECSATMPTSIPYCLDVLISLSKDDYPEVSQYCSTAINSYFTNVDEKIRLRTMDSLCDNFLALLSSLPRVLNNIDSSRKLSALHQMQGYIDAMTRGEAAQTLTSCLAAPAHAHSLRAALAAAAEMRHAASAHTLAHRDVLAPPPVSSPWVNFRHLDSPECVRCLEEICVALGGSECAELILDALLDAFQRERACEYVYIMNWMITSAESTVSMAKRIMTAYLEEDVWYSPLEVDVVTLPLTADDTLDVTVYNPREWHKETVPDLYEGTVETRYTPVSLHSARSSPRTRSPPTLTPAQARRHVTLSCLLTEGVGRVAGRLRDAYQPYMMRTLCLLLERLGSNYEMLHLAGLKAINSVSKASGHSSVTELITWNADYFTHQISVRLKRAWNCQSALQILSVVMEYSDASILDCLYGIVDDILVQSCDKYYENDILAYLQAFLTFVECIRKWFPIEKQTEPPKRQTIDLLAEVNEYVKSTQEAERLLSDSDFENSGKTAEELYKEDLKRKEGNELDYDDRVTEEAEGEGEGETATAAHVAVTATVVTRALNFISAPHARTALLAMQVVTRALPHLSPSPELLPLVHRLWCPLVSRLTSPEPLLKRAAFDLLLVMAAVAKDFIRSRAVEEVLYEIYKYLEQSSKCSYLKDAGSAYRNSHAYKLQAAALDALPALAVDLELDDQRLDDAMCCVDAYLSSKQPKPLQASAVKFFKTLLDYDYPATWFHLRKFCNNDAVLEPPTIKYMKLNPVVGTPFQHRDKEYENNIKLIFDFMVS